MVAEYTQSEEPRRAAIREMIGLREWPGAPQEFWARFAAALRALAGAARAVVMVKGAGRDGVWKKVAEHSVYSGPAHVNDQFSQRLVELAEAGSQNTETVWPLLGTPQKRSAPWAVAGRLELGSTTEVCIALLLVTEAPESALPGLLASISLAADTPRVFQHFREGTQARADVSKHIAVLDWLAVFSAEKRFLASAMALLNSIASDLECERASLGWLDGGYVRLKAMSRTAQFNRRMMAAQRLETVMEECVDQDEEIVVPPPEECRVVFRDHERYRQEERCEHLCSVPIRHDQKPVAVITCERRSRPFSLLELQQLRLASDLIASRLVELRRADRWFGARWTLQMREWSAKLVGPEHTAAKVVAILVTIALAVLLFPKVPYRVEGTFLVHSDELVFLSTPFDGYIREVLVRPGDHLTNRAPLLRLDTEELLLEESAALADLGRYQREVEKARAAKNLADMRIAAALTGQAEAQLKLIRYRLERATIRSPFEGVVAEGDLRERIGAPVKQGDTLFRVARLDRLYMVAEVNERDVHEILATRKGQVAFVGQPRLKFPVRIERVEPAGVSKKGQNVFLVRCEFQTRPESWWRPGMSGLCKLEAGRRTLLWILTHRTMDFLRMWLWW